MPPREPPHGGSPVSVWRLKAAELLKDGEWHDYRTIMRKVADAVPPGPALRQAKRVRKGALDESDPVMKRQFIRSGQRILAQRVLYEDRFEIADGMVRFVPYKVVTFEQYSEASKRAHAALTPEQRRERARKANETLGPEGRSMRTAKSHAGRTPEGKRRAGEKAAATIGTERKSAIMKAAMAKLTPEQRSARVRLAWEKRRQAEQGQ